MGIEIAHKLDGGASHCDTSPLLSAAGVMQVENDQLNADDFD
jgi:hypothetical protein